jgi:hypothetical protein
LKLYKNRRSPNISLLVLLKYLGTHGNAAANTSLANHFGIGEGTTELYRKRALEAILSLEATVVFWPDEEERKAMSLRIQKIFHFPNCVGLVDGTLLPLENKPSLFGENYLSRKSSYAVSVLVVCDEVARVLYYLAGWPGSVHDNRVWRNSKMYLNQDTFFSPMEYLLGDSAFTPGQHMIPAFKHPPKSNMPAEESSFNTLLAKPRVKSEHCIGLLKGRFPWLKNIRITIHAKKDLKQINKFIKAAVILHNLLIETPYEEEWIDEAFLELDNDDELNVQVPVDNPNNHLTRRDQLLSYFIELFHW